MLKYYILEKTQECKDFFFNNEGIFNFWNEYLIVHLNKLGDRYPVLVNRTGRKFHGGFTTPEAKRILKKRLKEEFCQTNKCAVQGNIPVTKYDAPLLCDLIKEWGNIVCLFTQY